MIDDLIVKGSSVCTTPDLWHIIVILNSVNDFRSNVHFTVGIPHEHQERQCRYASHRKRHVQTFFKTAFEHSPFWAGRLADAVSDERWTQYQKTKTVLSETRNRLESTVFSPQGWAKHGISVQFDEVWIRSWSRCTNFYYYFFQWFPSFTISRCNDGCAEEFYSGLADIDPRILGRIDIDGL